MIDWKDANKERPEEGQVIWYITRYRTGEIPDAFDIAGGTFEVSPCGTSARVVGRNYSCDYWPGHGLDDGIVGWCPVDQINVPSWFIEDRPIRIDVEVKEGKVTKVEGKLNPLEDLHKDSLHMREQK